MKNILKLLSILTIIAGTIQLLLGIYTIYSLIKVYIINPSVIGNSIATSTILIIAVSIVTTITAVLNILMGIFGISGANKNIKSLKLSRNFAMTSLTLSIINISLSFVAKSFSWSMILGVLYPLIFIFITFTQNLENIIKDNNNSLMNK